MAFGGDDRGLAHQRELVLGLVQAQVVQQMRQRDELVRRARERTAQGLHTLDPADQLEIELAVAAEVVVDARAALDHAGQDVVDVLDRERVVEAALLDRAVGPQARTVPGFARGIAVAAEQDGLGGTAAGQQHEHRIGLGKAAEVMEVAVLAIRIRRVVVAQPLRRGRHDDDGVVAGQAHELAAAARVFAGGDQERIRLSAGCGRRRRSARAPARAPCAAA